MEKNRIELNINGIKNDIDRNVGQNKGKQINMMELAICNSYL